jgi:hypothetical protein
MESIIRRATSLQAEVATGESEVPPFLGYLYCRTFAAGTIDLSQTGVDKGELLARGFGGGWAPRGPGRSRFACPLLRLAR